MNTITTFILGYWVLDYYKNENNTLTSSQIRQYEQANGFMIDTVFSSDIASGKMIVDDIVLYKSDLEKNDIKFSDIAEVELSFHVFDADSWNDIINTNPITIKFK